MNKIGILVNNLGLNEIAFTTINHVNSIHRLNMKYECSIFYKQSAKHCIKLAGLSTSMDRAFYYDGILIATDFDTLHTLINCRAAYKKIYYPFQLDWTLQERSYLHNYAIYNHPDLTIIVPSDEYNKAFTNYCGKPPKCIVPRFFLPKIVEAVL